MAKSKYYVPRLEVHLVTITVIAESVDEAIELVRAGEGEEQSACEFMNNFHEYGPDDIVRHEKNASILIDGVTKGEGV